MNVWFSLYNSRESIAAQVLAFLFVIGSYLVATYVRSGGAPREVVPRPN